MKISDDDKKVTNSHIYNFEELISQDPSNSTHWVRTLKNRPDLLQISSIDILQEILNLLLVEFEVSKKKSFALLEKLPEYFLQKGHQDDLRLRRIIKIALLRTQMPEQSMTRV